MLAEKCARAQHDHCAGLAWLGDTSTGCQCACHDMGADE